MTTRHTTAALLIGAAVALGACQDDASIVGPDDALAAGPSFAKPAPMDVSGVWHWNEHGRLILSAPGAGAFGVAPEGPRTILNCASSGELTIDQTGATFTGFTTQSSECVTAGGQMTDPAGFPPAADIIDGKVAGNHIEFTFAAGPVPCLYKVSATVENGVAVALNGTGKCIVPGHPLSPLPVPPPPLGGGKDIIDWKAVR